MNIEQVAAKLKSIRSGFKKPIDCSKKSGGVCAVFTFLNFCNDSWGGCPAVTSIKNSIDSPKLASNDDSDLFSSVVSSCILDITDAKDLSNEKEIHGLSNE